MHSAKDNRSRIDLASLDLTERLLVRFAQETDEKGMKF